MCIQKKSSSVKITLLLKVDLEGFEPLTSRMRTERSPMRTLKKPPKDKTFLLENGKKYRRNAVFWTSIAFEKKLPFLLQSELFIIALFRKMMLQRMGNRPRSDAQHSQLILYFLFPCASFVMLVILLYVTSGHNIEEFVSAGCCILIFISNVAVLFLLERMEYAASEREQLLMLNQQIQLQSKNMTSASELYSAQRKKVHDFRAHLNILNQLMKNQEYSAAEEYLEKITEQQTDRLFLVNTHHPILDALFNTKAAEATQKKISIDFEVNDLSNFPFDASDIVVLLSNLLDNAIEACQQYDKGDKAIHVMAVAQQDFFVSVRNTSEPVVIISGSIPTTKPEPQMHGFGLANIRLILEKYSGEYTMFYENGWFQFTADIPLTPIS